MKANLNKIGWLFFVLLLSASIAMPALYWDAGVRSKTISVCFVGDAVTKRPDRVKQIQTYLKEFEYAANIRFNYMGKCPDPTKQANGDDFYNGDIRVVLPNINVTDSGPVSGKGCPMFKDANGNYNGENNGGSWSNPPSDLEKHRACRYNLKLGDNGDTNGTPWLNHTLHEFGHALGLSHEHARFDVDRDCAVSYLLQIPGLTKAEAGAIFDAGFRNVCEIADTNTTIAALQKISGFNTVSAATNLQNKARGMKNPVCYGGNAKNGYMTPYDRRSVMHYKFAGCGINGNYDNTGFSEWDRLALHILYPEDNQVAEFVGATVVRTTDLVTLQSAWKARGANLSFVANSFAWKISANPVGSTPDLSTKLTNPGDYPLQFSHNDFLGRSYSYSGTIRVLTPAVYNQQIAAPVAAQLPLF